MTHTLLLHMIHAGGSLEDNSGYLSLPYLKVVVHVSSICMPSVVPYVQWCTALYEDLSHS